MFWAGLHPHDIPVRDVLIFNEHAEDIFEEYRDVMKSAVAEGVSEVLDNLKI